MVQKNKTHYKPISRFYPAHHPKAGQPTGFVLKLWSSLSGQKIDIPKHIEIGYLVLAGLTNKEYNPIYPYRDQPKPKK